MTKSNVSFFPSILLLKISLIVLCQYAKLLTAGPNVISLIVSLALDVIRFSNLSIFFLPGISTEILSPILRMDASVTPLSSILSYIIETFSDKDS